MNIRWKLPDLQYNFYDAWIYDVTLGPRREITVHLELWPEGNNGHVVFQQSSRFKVDVRFGGIVNLDEINAFFTSWVSSQNYRNGLHYLAYDPLQLSKPDSLFLKFQFDRSGTELTIHCKNVTVTRCKQPNAGKE